MPLRRFFSMGGFSVHHSNWEITSDGVPPKPRRPRCCACRATRLNWTDAAHPSPTSPQPVLAPQHKKISSGFGGGWSCGLVEFVANEADFLEAACLLPFTNESAFLLFFIFGTNEACLFIYVLNHEAACRLRVSCFAGKSRL